MWKSWKFWAVWGLIFGLIALFAFGFFVDPKNVPSPLVGKPAPDFEISALNGDLKIRLSDFKGKPVLLNYWASWCQECKVEAHILEAFHQKYGSATQQIKVIGIAVHDTAGKAKSFASLFGKTYFLGLDDAIGNTALDYGIYGVPETFFIDPEGKIFYKHIGAVNAELLEKKFKPFL
jgi:cytochrome c biogenesis protein CcmG/thiol:disulfide interchange protein DsbE